MSIRDAKLNYIVDTATDLFIEHSVREVTVRDIAEKAGVGEATVYRYFARKQNIVQAAAEKLQTEILSHYYRAMPGKTGAERLKAFYDVYLRVFSDHPEFYRFELNGKTLDGREWKEYPNAKHAGVTELLNMQN